MYNGSPLNWSPFAPSVLTFDELSLAKQDMVPIGSLPNITINTSGNLTLGVNGSWNPDPANTTARDWVMLVIIANGIADFRALDAYTPVRISVSDAQLPFQCFFALPSPIGFSAPSSSAAVTGRTPSGNIFSLGLAPGAAGLDVSAAMAVAALPSKTVWFNAHGNWRVTDFITTPANFSVILPQDGTAPFASRADQPYQWAAPDTFPGALTFLFMHNASVTGNGGMDINVWTTGDPESGLFINASMAPLSVLRGADVTLQGTVGNRSLRDSTNWVVDPKEAESTKEDNQSCTNVMRLQSGGYRLFCSYANEVGPPPYSYGVNSLFSDDGISWVWENNDRFLPCGGERPLNQLAMVRRLSGMLRMYYSGPSLDTACGFNATTHISTAISFDEGYTWLPGIENVTSFGVANASSLAVVPTPAGDLRMYLNSDSGLFSALSSDGRDWEMEGPVSGPAPRTVYLLADGTYKMYYGITSIYSSTSTDGINWAPGQLEIAAWAGDVEAGPLIDRGDGSLIMLLYSQADGLFTATLGTTPISPTVVTAKGALSHGTLFTNATTTSATDRSFAFNLTTPPLAAPGGFSVSAATWFGGLAFSAVILSGGPLWLGPASVVAVEDIPLSLDLADWAFDPDLSDPLFFQASTAYGSVSGSVLTLLYPDAVLSDTVFGNVTDGFQTVQFSFQVFVTQINDPPTIALAASYAVLEDTPAGIDLNGAYADEETPTSALTLSTNATGATVAGSVITFLYSLPGTADVTIGVSDGTWLVNATTQIIVMPIDDPPVLTGTPPNASPDGSAVTFQFGAKDEDDTSGFVYILGPGAPSWITITANGLLTISPPPREHGRVSYTVAVLDPSGAPSPARTFTFDLPANRLPVMTPSFDQLPADAVPGVLFSLSFTITDPDGDPLQVTRVWSDPNQNVTLRQTGGDGWAFEWLPTYTYTRDRLFLAWLNGSVAVDDSFGVARFNFSIRALDPPDRRPVINGTIPDLFGAPGQRVTIDLTPFMFDPDPIDTVEFLLWSFDGSTSDVGAFSYDPQTHEFTFLFSKAGNATLLFRLSDPSRLNDTQLVFIRGVVTNSSPAAEPFPWWLLLVAAGAGTAAAIGYARYGRPAPINGSAAGGVGTAPAAPAASQAAALARPTHSAHYVVEDVFLLYRDGRTIYARAGSGSGTLEDPESLGAMLLAVRDFVLDAFKKGEAVDRMGYGDSAILFEKGDAIMLAATVFGEAEAEFRDLLTETARKVEATYAGVIESWFGDRADFVGVESLLQPLWQGTAHLSRSDVLMATTGQQAQMLSGIEFFQGYVRLKIALVNNAPTALTGIAVDIDYSADVLRLHKIEPRTYKTAGSKVHLGVLHPGEKASLAYYFDPQICTSSAINGEAVYRDLEGNPHALQMKARRAEVVCPLFFTKEHANTATLRRLLETKVTQFDVRAYATPEHAVGAQRRAAFEALKSAVLAHDVQLVRSFERHNPYFAEAWFYGTTQGKNYPVIVRAVVDESKGRAEFFVASTAMPLITGLLAELHHTLQATSSERVAGLRLKPLFDERVRDEYGEPASVARLVDGGAEPARNGGGEPR